MEPGGRGAPGKTKAKGRVADTMSRARVAICALIAMFALAALAAPAIAKKETKREFVASGTAKLGSNQTGADTQFIFAFEEKGALKITCGTSEGKGEVVPTEGKASTFTAKVKYGGCSTPGAKKFPIPIEISAFELEFNANGLVSILNEVKVKGLPKCTIFLPAQTVGLEEFEEGKKGPVVYHQEGTPDTPASKVKVEIKTHVHEEGEANGLAFEQEEGHCGEFKTEGGKWKSNMIVAATAPKESWISVHEETIVLPKE